MNNRFLLRELITELRRARLQRANLAGMLAPTSGFGALGLMGRRRLRRRLAFHQEVIKGLLSDLDAFDRKARNIKREGTTADFDDVTEEAYYAESDYDTAGVWDEEGLRDAQARAGEKAGEEVYQKGHEKRYEEAIEAPEEVQTERERRKRASTKSSSTKRAR